MYVKKSSLTHKHRWIIKSTNRTEYWFTCDNCGKDEMMTKYDFWDLRYYIKRRVRLDEEFESWINSHNRMKAAREGYYDKVEERKEEIKKEIQETSDNFVKKSEEQVVKTNNWEDFDHPIVVTYAPYLSRMERFRNWFWRTF